MPKANRPFPDPYFNRNHIVTRVAFGLAEAETS
jgi:hypothetical protein